MIINSGKPASFYVDCHTVSLRCTPSIAEFYAQDIGPANLEMLSRFFEKYPDYADKTFLSVKVRFTLAASQTNAY